MPKNDNHKSSPSEGKDIGMRKFTRFSFVLLTFLVWQPLVLLAIFWLKIPLEIPTNFDFFGGITGYGEKTQLLILAAISLMIYVEHLLFVGLVPRKADTKGLISMRFSAVSDPSDVSRARSIIIGALTGVNAAIVLMLDYVMLTSAFGYAPRYAIPVTALLMLITYVWYERRMRAVKIELEKRVAITPKNN